MGQSSLYCRYGCGVARAELPDKAFSQLSLLVRFRCDQPRALDLGARSGKKLETAPDAIVNEVLAKLTTIFE